MRIRVGNVKRYNRFAFSGKTGASAEEPEDTIEEAVVVGSWAACFGLLRGQ